MAKADVTLTVTVKDFASVKLLTIQLRMLLDEMRVMASPHAGKLEAILDSFNGHMSDGGPDDGSTRPERAP